MKWIRESMTQIDLVDGGKSLPISRTKTSGGFSTKAVKSGA